MKIALWNIFALAGSVLLSVSARAQNQYVCVLTNGESVPLGSGAVQSAATNPPKVGSLCHPTTLPLLQGTVQLASPIKATAPLSGGVVPKPGVNLTTHPAQAVAPVKGTSIVPNTYCSSVPTGCGCNVGTALPGVPGYLPAPLILEYFWYVPTSQLAQAFGQTSLPQDQWQIGMSCAAEDTLEGFPTGGSVVALPASYRLVCGAGVTVCGCNFGTEVVWDSKEWQAYASASTLDPVAYPQPGEYCTNLDGSKSGLVVARPANQLQGTQMQVASGAVLGPAARRESRRAEAAGVAADTTNPNATCQFNSGPLAGKAVPYHPAQLAHLGDLCQDGKGSYGRVLIRKK